MKKIREALLPLCLLMLIPLINVFYLLLNNSSRGVYILVTRLDEAIPFIKFFAIPYLMWYPFIAATLIYFCFCNRVTYYKVLSSLLIGMSISFIIYYFFQTSVPRPQVQGNDFFTLLIKAIYQSDKPFNCFPSIHVLSSYLMVKGIYTIEKRKSITKIAIVFAAILVILSTQFIKQHVALDVIFAMILAEGIYKTMNIIIEGSKFIFKNKKAADSF